MEMFSASEFQLYGPPGLRHNPLPAPPPTPAPVNESESETETETESESESEAESVDPEVVASDEDEAPPPPMGFTENKSLTYLATGNLCVDFFFHIVPDSPPSEVIKRVSAAWGYDPLTTLKLICNLRGVRGTGKSDKENFYVAALWLHQHHPKTLASNIGVFAEFGYFKDLLEILYRILEGSDVRSRAKEECIDRKMARRNGRNVQMHHRGKRGEKKCKSQRVRKLEAIKKRELEKQLRSSVPREKRIEANMAKVEELTSRARVLRKEKKLVKANKALERYKNDADYRFLYDQIAKHFAEILKSDLEKLKSDEIGEISLAAKWCPKIDSAYDKATLIYESIARKVYPRENYAEYDGIEEGHYAYRVRDRLRREVLVPLRKALQLPEVYMSAKQWDVLPYNRVASVAMKNYKEIFLLRDGTRFEQYLEDVKQGKATIAAGALLPHEIIKSLNDGDEGKVAELQWSRMVDDLAKLGRLSNCIAVCDVSGSMIGIPMEVSVALGLMISELSEEPWKGNVITFSESPQLHKIEGNTLLEKTNFIRQMESGMNTDFQKVFDRILEVAANGNLTEDQLIKRVFVFSDMEFDEASGNYSSPYGFGYGTGDSEIVEAKEARGKVWETDYEVIQKKFRDKGFNKVPEIVFWNLRSSFSTPVTAKQNGVALVSGFSKNMVTVFLEEGGLEKFNPIAVMEKAISGELYDKLVVSD